jgi:hypothetical protein
MSHGFGSVMQEDSATRSVAARSFASMETEPHYFDDGVMGCEAGNKETAASRPAATVSKFSHAMIVRQARGMGSNYADVESEILLVVKSIHGRRICWFRWLVR